ncbi:hypothetical protein KEM56_003796 [Ascosphaera pollenicola]|nr:hypothetical protein KEM56_003796 [Ascosphaera pollenicola]
MAQQAHPIKRVAIIGAGPCGLAAAKYLLAEKSFDKIDLFEQRDEVGGVWNISNAADKEKDQISIPQLDAHPPPEDSEHPEREAFSSPMYQDLETNIPKELMGFSDLAFPKECQVFPRHQDVKEYLIKYAKDIRSLIQFQTHIIGVEPDNAQLGTWRVTRRYLKDNSVKTSVYDAVVASNGHYAVPSVPAIPGISAWHKAFPETIIHAKQYLSRERYDKKKVLVIGNSASGVDISAQISEVCELPILMSVRSKSELPPRTVKQITYPEIEVFLDPETHDRAVQFKDGHVEEHIDAIIFCTGYLYSLPFIKGLTPPLISDGQRVQAVYQHLFHIEHPTIVFPVLAQRVVPLPQAENQAAVFSRVWSGRLTLPSKEEMYRWEEEVIQRQGSGKGFHYLSYPQDRQYLNLMYEWAISAESRSGLENKGQGKIGAYWGEEQGWIRERIAAMRDAFARQGERRHSITSLKELGFEFAETLARRK